MTTEERLEMLEQELTNAKRRIRWIIGSVTILVLGCLTIAATPGDSKIIRANKFVLEDVNGITLADLGLLGDKPTLTFCDMKGEFRSTLSADALFMSDKNGKLRVSVNIGNDGPKLALHDESGKVRAEISVNEHGPGFMMFDEIGKKRLLLSAFKNEPALLMQDENEKIRAMMTVVKKGPIISIADKQMMPIWSTP